MKWEMRICATLLGCGTCLAGTRSATAQALGSQPVVTYTLERAIAVALEKHPRLAGARAEVAAADARTEQARATELPSLGVSAQINRSTGNTVPGTFFQTPGFPAISGAPRGRAFDSGAWQTGASLWATWDVLSPVRDAADVDAALAGEREASALADAQRLEVAYRAADSFFLVLEAQEATRAAEANRARARTLVEVVTPLVEQNLRPGAELARARAELASAETLLARTEQARDVRRAEFAQTLGTPNAAVDAAPDGVTGPLDDWRLRTGVRVETNPRVLAANASIERAAQEERRVELAYLPRVDVCAAIWLRGSGYYGSPADGTVPDIPNWAAGATFTWNFFELSSIRARAKVAAADHSLAVAKHDETYLAVASELSSASTVLKGALAVSKQTPMTLAAAQAAEQQASARYKTGLTSIVEVADADRVLSQAEMDDAVARLEVRRALLSLARASGDLGPFVHPRGGH